MDSKELLEIVAEILEVEVSDLDLATELASFDEWDSLAIVSFMAMADERHGAQVSAAQLESIKTIEELFALVK